MDSSSCPTRRSARLLSSLARPPVKRKLEELQVEGGSSRKQRRGFSTELSADISNEEAQTGEDDAASLYGIPEVVKKTTTFKGRLGYACLNTVLRNQKPEVFCSRTCRLISIQNKGADFVKNLGRQNIRDLLPIIQWNETNNIRFFRLSSDMFPFASHAEHGYSLEYCSTELAAAGAVANKFGHRLTVHPGQYTQLGSPRSSVVEAAVRDLTYHCQMLDLMSLGPDSVIILHGGGVYNDKPGTLNRLKNSIQQLPENVRNRLVLENDELCYKAEDLLPLCEELNVPLILDYHHNNLNPSSISVPDIIERANAIFKRRGIKPKQHLSEPPPGAISLMEKKAHSNRCNSLPEHLPDDMDLMIEAKDKEQAVFQLYRIYDLYPVREESLRPPASASKKKVRKSKKAKEQADQAGQGKRKSDERKTEEERVIYHWAMEQS